MANELAGAGGNYAMLTFSFMRRIVIFETNIKGSIEGRRYAMTEMHGKAKNRDSPFCEGLRRTAELERAFEKFGNLNQDSQASAA